MALWFLLVGLWSVREPHATTASVAADAPVRHA
jgi:hypothetical protein